MRLLIINNFNNYIQYQSCHVSIFRILQSAATILINAKRYIMYHYWSISTNLDQINKSDWRAQTQLKYLARLLELHSLKSNSKTDIISGILYYTLLRLHYIHESQMKSLMVKALYCRVDTVFIDFFFCNKRKG